MYSLGCISKNEQNKEKQKKKIIKQQISIHAKPSLLGALKQDNLCSTIQAGEDVYATARLIVI
jgi:hypothetical protein